MPAPLIVTESEEDIYLAGVVQGARDLDGAVYPVYTTPKTDVIVAVSAHKPPWDPNTLDGQTNVSNVKLYWDFLAWKAELEKFSSGWGDYRSNRLSWTDWLANIAAAGAAPTLESIAKITAGYENDLADWRKKLFDAKVADPIKAPPPTIKRPVSIAAEVSKALPTAATVAGIGTLLLYGAVGVGAWWLYTNVLQKRVFAKA